MGCFASCVYACVQVLAKSDAVGDVLNSRGAPYSEWYAALNSVVDILQFKGHTRGLKSISGLLTRWDHMMNTTNQDSTTVMRVLTQLVLPESGGVTQSTTQWGINILNNTTQFRKTQGQMLWVEVVE